MATVDRERVYRYVIRQHDELLRDQNFTVLYVQTGASYEENSPGLVWLGGKLGAVDEVILGLQGLHILFKRIGVGNLRCQGGSGLCTRDSALLRGVNCESQICARYPCPHVVWAPFVHDLQGDFGLPLVRIICQGHDRRLCPHSQSLAKL